MKKLKRTLTVLLVTFLTLSLIGGNASAASFKDTRGHWAERVIDKWSKMGIIRGYDGMFNPDEGIIRGDMAVILCRVMKYEVMNTNTFSDLDMTEYYADEVLMLNHEGVMLGADGYVRPLDKITREEAFSMLNRIYKYEGGDAPVFEDVDCVSDWARDDVYALCASGIIHGSEGKINPTDNITRAEIIQLLENISVSVKFDSTTGIGEDDLWVGEIR